MNKLPIIAKVPRAMSLNALRDALHAAHLPCIVAPVDRDGVKLTPGQGISREQAAAFLAGFIAGFQA